MARSVPAQVREAWERLSKLPGGPWLFSRMVGRMAPYTGSVGAVVRELEPGYARVTLRDRPAVRNHLRSVHAVALLNLAEMATGLAMLAGLPDDARGILVGLSMEYHKKARGTLTATCRCPVADSSERREYAVVGEVHDEAGERVATATARWLVSPERPAGP